MYGSGRSGPDLERIFPGDSEMAARMRAFDWSTSDIGPPDRWPQNLRLALGICLAARFPLHLWWGPSQTLFYNDACIPFLGTRRHPAALGRSVREAWPEIWERIGPRIEPVLRTGTASWPEDLVMVFDREQPKEELYATLSFSPVPGERGAVEGIFCTCTETTGKPIGARGLDRPRVATADEVRRAADDIPTPAPIEAVQERTGPLTAADAALRRRAGVRDRAEAALRDSEAEMAAELADMKQLQLIGSQLIQEEDSDVLYGRILDASIALMRSDMASMQIFFPETSELRLLAWKGFHPASAAFWKQVRVDSATPCGAALRKGERVIVPDAEGCESMAGTEDLAQFRLSGIRAVQSTPLISRGGRFVGMISNHWREPHQPPVRKLRLLDILSHEAANLLERIKADEALRESEERYRALINATSHVLYRMSPDWREMRQLQGGDFLADTAEPNRDWLQEYIHPDDQQRVLEAIGKAVQTGTVFELEHRVRRADGTLGWTFSRAVPLRNAVGEIVEWFGAASDVSERKQAETALAALNERLEALVAERTAALGASEQRFRALIEASTQIVWTTDAQGEANAGCPSWFAFTGQTREQCMGGNWSDVVHPDDREFAVESWRGAVATSIPLDTEFRLWHAPTRAWRWNAVRAVPLRDGEGAVHGWVGMNTDIEVRKRAESQLHRMASELTMVEQEERRRISQILHDDLQQQLYMVRMQMAQLIRDAEDGAADQLTAATKELYAQIGEAITVTRRLSVDLSPPVIEGEGLADALGWLASQMEQMHGLSVEVDAPDACVIKDANMRVLLFQIARELLFNVVKHAGTDRARTELRQENGELLMRVTDDGLGFDVEHAKQRADRGFGLFSAYDRLGLFGGTMEIDARPGAGTRVAVRLPLAQAGRRTDEERRGRRQ